MGRLAVASVYTSRMMLCPWQPGHEQAETGLLLPGPFIRQSMLPSCWAVQFRFVFWTLEKVKKTLNSRDGSEDREAPANSGHPDSSQRCIGPPIEKSSRENLEGHQTRSRRPSLSDP